MRLATRLQALARMHGYQADDVIGRWQAYPLSVSLISLFAESPSSSEALD
jgi:hypothetical protein